MLALGLLLVAAGVVAILAALFGTSGSASFLGADLGATTLFFLGVGTAVAVLVGSLLMRAGVARSLRHRRESRRIREIDRTREEGGEQPPST
jgi:uncharacterized integral membrane protein